MNTGVISMGVRCPIIRQGDNLVDIVIGNVKKTLEEIHMSLEDKDVIGITESVVARSQGNYVTVDDIVKSIAEVAKEKANGTKNVILYEPIMSRNRFAMILKAFARYADNIIMVHGEDVDQQGNPTWKPNPFTGVDIEKYYAEICEAENCQFQHIHTLVDLLGSTINDKEPLFTIDARCHPDKVSSITLASFMNKPIAREDGTQSGYNSDWGLLGSNKANEETLKLYPQKDKAQKLVDDIQQTILEEEGKKVEVLVYGDGNFCSPAIPGVLGSQINEWADPCNPAWTNGLNGSPNEVKIKAFADGKFKHLTGDELESAIKDEIKDNLKDLKGNMTAQGTTPRRYTDLLASLFDLLSGSGDKGCPVGIIKRYFKKYCDD